MKSRVLSILLIVTALCCGITQAQIPRKLNFQGYLTTPTGAPVNTPQTLIARIYDLSSGGSALFIETHNSVTVSNGIFNILLGSVDTNVNPLNLSFSTQYYLGITVGTDPEMTPRQPLAASPYAIRAASAESLAASATVAGSQITGAISTATLPTTSLTGTIATAQIADASVTAAKLASNSCSSGQVLQYNGSAWVCATPAGSSGGTVTSITAGTGLTGGTVTGSGTLAADATFLQRRVAATCAVGSSIRAIAADGSVTCQTDTTGGSGTVTSITAGAGLTGGTITGSGTIGLGTVPVANGGTGQTSLTSNGIVIGQGGSALTTTAAGSAGQVLAGSAGAPTWTGSPSLSGNLTLVDPSTTTAGNIMKGSSRFLHNAGFANTFVGVDSGNFTVTGSSNTITGANALGNVTSGQSNTASGVFALTANTSGSYNIALGIGAGGSLTTGDFNIDIGNAGVAGEAATIRLGTSQTRTFVAGIRGTATVSVDRLPVVIDANGQLGTTAAVAKAKNTLVVSATGGDFTTISAALTSIADNTASNRYVIYVGPGTYTEKVTMKQFVDIQGAGELTTKVTFGGNASSATGTVLGASNAELRFLTVENSGGDLYAVAIFNSAASPRLMHVTANAFGGGNLSAGVLSNASASPTMNNVTASATGSTPGTLNVGVYNSDASTTISNSVISASGGSINWGIANSGSAPGSYTVLVNHSRIVAATSTIVNDNLFTTRVGASQLSGGAVNALFGTITCAGVYDEAYFFFAFTCP